MYLESKSKASTQQEKSPLDPENFKDFKLKKIEPYNHNTSRCVRSFFTRFTMAAFEPHRFLFELPNNEAALTPVASCLTVRASDPEALKDAKGNPIIRPYTPISAPDEKGVLTLLVKKYENGNASKHIHSLKASVRHLCLFFFL